MHNPDPLSANRINLNNLGTAEWDKNPSFPDWGVFLGKYENQFIRDNNQAHTLTFALTGSGKGASSIIPTLLTYEGSALVIDPKGENALNTLGSRKKEMGQDVYVLDPLGQTGLKTARFNPLEFIGADGDKGPTNAGRIADMLIIPGGNDPHWPEGAKSILKAVILHVCLSDEFDTYKKTLPTVYSLIQGSQKELLDSMAENKKSALVKRIAKGLLVTPEKEIGHFFSTIRTNLAAVFDDPRLCQCMEGKSSFTFEQLKEQPGTVYLVLPVQDLAQFSRWLRLMVATAIYALASIKTKPEKPVLFILDEFAHLGHLEAIKTAMGLMRGFGVKLWPVLQNLSQLKTFYREEFETFIANAGMIEIYGVNDNTTAEYFSRRLGNQTMQISNFGSSVSPSLPFGNNSGGSSSFNMSSVARPLLLPDEIMRLPYEKKIIMRQGKKPFIAQKAFYFDGDPLSESSLVDQWKRSKKYLKEEYPALFRENTLEFV